MKEIIMTDFDKLHFMKIVHFLNDGVIGLDIFILENYQATQLNPGVLSPKDEGKLISGVYDRPATKEEVLMAEEILEKRAEYALNKTIQYVNAFGESTLLTMLEVGGRYFAYINDNHLRFNRLAEIVLTPENLPPDIGEVPKDFLPAVIQNLPGEMLPQKNKGMTIQIGEGVFVRLKRHSMTMFATVIVMDIENDIVKRLSAPLGFALSHKNGAWEALPEDPELTGKMHEEMQKAFDHVNLELSMLNNQPNT